MNLNPNNHPINWESTKEFIKLLEKQKKTSTLSTEEYLQEKEAIIRNFLAHAPNNEQANETLADILIEKLITLPAITTKEQIYRELVHLSPRPAFRNQFAKILLTKKQDENTYMEVIGILLQTNNFPAYFLNIFSDPVNIQPKSRDLDELETLLLRLNEITPKEDYQRLLANVLYLKINEQPAATIEEFDHIEKSFAKIIKRASSTAIYAEKYLQYLYKKEHMILENEFLSEQKTELQLETYRKILNLLENNEGYLIKIESALKEKLQFLERKMNDQTLNNHQESIYRELVRLRPNNIKYKKELANLLLSQGYQAKTNRNFDDAHKYYDEIFQTSSEAEKVKAHYYKGLLNLQQQNWKNAELHFSEILKNKKLLGNELLFDFYLSYAICCIHLQKTIKVEQLVQIMKTTDLSHKHLKEIEFVQMYVNLFGKIKYFQVYEVGKESQLLDYAQVEKLIENSLEEESNQVVLDLRNPEYPILIGPNGSKDLTTEQGEWLRQIIHLKYPMKWYDLIRNLGYPPEKFTNDSFRDEIRKINQKMKENVLLNYEGKLANAIQGQGYLWHYKGSTYIIEDTESIVD